MSIRKSSGEVITPPIIFGDKSYKFFQPTPCDVCQDYRPAHICIYIDGSGIVCDQCQSAGVVSGE